MRESSEETSQDKQIKDEGLLGIGGEGMGGGFRVSGSSLGRLSEMWPNNRAPAAEKKRQERNSLQGDVEAGRVIQIERDGDAKRERQRDKAE